MKLIVFTKKDSEQNTDLTDKLNKAMDDPDSEMITACTMKLMKFPFYFQATPLSKYLFPFKHLFDSFPL